MPEPKDNSRSTATAKGHLNFAQGSYLESTSRPLYALIFLLPFVVFYELGTVFVHTDQIAHTQGRVATFTWLRGLAEWIGVHYSLAWAFPGFVVVVILLCWHLSARHSWRLRIRWILWMYPECVILSLPLLILNAVLSSSLTCAAVSPDAPSGTFIANTVTSIGAGIYEELVFRLILVGLILMLMEDVLKVKGAAATVAAVLISAALFAAHHYVGFDRGHLVRMPDEQFTLLSFMFRTAAGIYFALIFHYRGYGIIAGTHAAYNIILYPVL